MRGRTAPRPTTGGAARPAASRPPNCAHAGMREIKHPVLNPDTTGVLALLRKIVGMLWIYYTMDKLYNTIQPIMIVFVAYIITSVYKPTIRALLGPK